MVTNYEVQKLRESMCRELNAGSLSVWQSVAGLLIVGVLVTVGTEFGPFTTSHPNLAQAQEQRQLALNKPAQFACSKKGPTIDTAPEFASVAGTNAEEGC